MFYPPVQSAHFPRYRRSDVPLRVVIGCPKSRILQSLATFQYLSAPQLARLDFSPGSLTYVREHLKELFHAGYIRRLFLPTIRPTGSSLAIYALDRQGLAYLRQHGAVPPGRFRPSEQRRREEFYLAHTLACNDFLILACQFVRSEPRLKLGGLLTERELKRRPIRLADPNRARTKLYICPDAWLNLHLDLCYQLPFALELDRATEDKAAFQRKIRGLVQSTHGAYQATFGTSSLTVLFLVAVGGEHRLVQMLDWTEQQLSDLRATDYADLFRFASLDPTQVAPRTAFAAPFWRRPFDPRLHPLIPMIGG